MINIKRVKKFLKENGQMSDDKYKEFNYACNYYHEHRKELLEKKRLYRQKKRLERRK